MTSRIVVLDGATHGLVDRLRAVRAAGDIPLVDDVRRPEAEREAVRALVRDARPPADAAWATLTSGSSGTPRIVLRTAASWAESFPAVSALLYDDAVSDAERVVALEDVAHTAHQHARHQPPASVRGWASGSTSSGAKYRKRP